MLTIPTAWARRKAKEIIRKNNITTSWQTYNTMDGVSATCTEATADIVAAFEELGYEMHQPGSDWKIRRK